MSERTSAICGGCHTLVTFDLDENGKGVLPAHGPKMACPWNGKEISYETPEIRAARIKAEMEKEPTGQRGNDHSATALMMAVTSAIPMYLFNSRRQSQIERPKSYRRFPIPR